MLLNPAPMSVSLELMVWSGKSGLAGDISNVKLKAVLSSSVADTPVTGRIVTFLIVISTFGPPGLMGASGPRTETTSIMSGLAKVVVVEIVDVVVTVVAGLVVEGGD